MSLTALFSWPAWAAATDCIVHTNTTCLVTEGQLNNAFGGVAKNTAPILAQTLRLAPGYTLIGYSGLNRTGERIQLEATPHPQARLGWATTAGLRWLWVARSPANPDRSAKTAPFNVPASAQVFSPLACASEGGSCTLPAPAYVAFGVGNSFTVLQKSGRFVCSTIEFGDPSFGASKACHVMAGDAEPRQIERLKRGLVAVRQGAGVYMSWRLLATDPANIAFNVYHSRHSNGDGRTLLTPQPVKDATQLKLDSTVHTSGYFTVVPVQDGVEQAALTETVRPWNDQYLDIPVIPPSGRLAGSTYDVKDASVGDLDGDGDYEIIIKWEPNSAKDNSQPGITDNTYIDAYQLNGTRLWRIDLGPNIRSGGHYTPMMVFDFDGDGRAELAMRTADGTIDGRGALIGKPNQDHANEGGYVLEGAEYLTFFRGTDGRVLAQTAFKPGRGDRSQWENGWGDSWGNRVDRFLGGVAYLDGKRPSLIMARGYYERSVIGAWDLSKDANGRYQITQRWMFDTHDERLIPAGKKLPEGQNPSIRHPSYTGQGSHTLAIADVDFDGRDDIVYGAAVIRHDGTPGHSTRKGHGDALQVSDFDPARPGLEIMTVHESSARHQGTGLMLRKGEGAGDMLWGRGSCTSNDPAQVGDVGRGIVMDIDPQHPGAESWSSNHALVSAAGLNVFPGASGNDPQAACTKLPGGVPLAGVYWDGDLLREIWGRGQTIGKYKWWEGDGPAVGSTYGLYDPGHGQPLRTFRGLSDAGVPLLVADVLGDWREEVLLYASSLRTLRLSTTVIPTNAKMLLSDRPLPRIPTLMHDTQYRSAVAGQNSAYNQQPNPSFFLGEGMNAPARRPVATP